MERKNFEVDLNDIICRKANEGDDIKRLASLIYQTDPYIYPYWFTGGEEEAINFLKDKITMPGFVFYYDNIYIAVDKKSGEIVGLIVSFEKNTNLDFDYTPYENISENYKVAIERYVKGCINEVKESDDLYIMNCTVDKNHRGRAIGTRMLGAFIKVMENYGYENFSLDCLLHNLAAKNLYHSLGFLEVKEALGFQGVGKERPELVVFRRKKGKYLENEFQKHGNYKGLKR